jgi:alkylation response protein AidB-like acyl-CoA dehydrogenase
MRVVGSLSSRLFTRSFSSGRPALTVLSEEEVMLQEMVRKFAQDQVKPHVLAMDEKAKMRPEIVQECFNAGLMGIETPTELQGAGMSFFSSIVVIEELARIDPSVSVMVVSTSWSQGSSEIMRGCESFFFFFLFFFCFFFFFCLF